VRKTFLSRKSADDLLENLNVEMDGSRYLVAKKESENRRLWAPITECGSWEKGVIQFLQDIFVIVENARI
jgi:hypothetical protein